jgi:hypothetical protein
MITIIIFFVCFGVYNYSQSENITIKVKDKRVFTTTSGDKNSVSSTTHYRIVSEDGEYFDCVTFSFNPTSTEKLYNSFDVGKTYSVEVRGIKSDYNIRDIVEVKSNGNY